MSRSTSFFTAASHASQKILNGLLTKHLLTYRAKTCDNKSGSYPSKLGGNMFPLPPGPWFVCSWVGKVGLYIWQVAHAAFFFLKSHSQPFLRNISTFRRKVGWEGLHLIYVGFFCFDVCLLFAKKLPFDKQALY